MKNTWRRLGLATLLVSSVALAQTSAQTGAHSSQAGTTPGALGLVSKLRAAYGDLTHARSLLRSSSGPGERAQSLLSKAERDLDLVRSALPTGAVLAKLDQARAALGGAGAQKGQASGILAEAKGLAARLDPELASKLGQAQTHAQNGNAAQASSRIDEARAKLKGSALERAYDQVVAARTALTSGKPSTASRILGELPSLSSLEGTVQRELSSATGVGGSGSSGIKLPGGFRPTK